MAFQVLRLKIKLHDGSIWLRRQNGRVNPISRQTVSMRAVVEHRHGRKTGRSIDAIVERNSQAVSVLIKYSSADGDDVRRLRNDRRMGDFKNQRGDIALRDGIDPAGCAIEDRTGAPVLAVNVRKIWVNQFKGFPQPIVFGQPFPALPVPRIDGEVD